jgi:ATP-dependent Lon protease
LSFFEGRETTIMADDKMSLAGAVPLSADAPVPEQVPILPLRDTVLFPQSALPLGAGRESSVRLLEDVVRGGRLIGVFTQRDPTTEDPQEADLHRVGTLATVHKVLKQPDGTVRLVVQGLHRIRITEMLQVRPYLTARIAPVSELSPPAGDLETEALARNAGNLFRQVVELSPMLPDELATVAQNVTQPDRLGDLIAATLPVLTTQVKQELLETPDVKARLARLVSVLTKEVEVLALGSKIQSQVESEVGRSQREYYLREQLKAIQKELGQTDDRAQELDELRAKIEAAGMTEEAHKEAVRELDRLSKMPPAAAEYTVARTYLDWLVALPWSKQTTDNLDINEARRVLDEDHSGLEKVKDRILEYLAVKSMRPGGKDPILCLCWTRWTSSARTSAAIRPPRSSRCSTPSRTWRSGTTTSTWRSISPRFCSSRPRTSWIRCRRRCVIGWRSSRSRATPRRRRSASRRAISCRNRSPTTA